jgi:ankyrin repeat protein
MRSTWIGCGLAACALAWAIAAGAGGWNAGGLGIAGLDIATAPDFRRDFSRSTEDFSYERAQPKAYSDPAGIDDLLFRAVERNDLDAAGRLLDQGAHPNAVVDDAGTRLLMTVRSASMARLLVAKGADPTLSDVDGATALHRLVTTGAALNLIPVLMEAGGDIHARAHGWRGETAVLATWRLFIDMGLPEQGEKVVRMLAAYGADLNTFDADGFNLLLIGAANNSAELVRVVLDLGGRMDVTTREGLSALDLARELRCAEAAALLEEAAAN